MVIFRDPNCINRANLTEAGFSPITFSDDTSGSLVFISTRYNFGHGWLFLYRANQGRAELVKVAAEGIIWGIRRFGDRDIMKAERAGVEPVQLFAQTAHERHLIVKVIGSVIGGTGIWNQGCIHLLDVRIDGWRTIFADCEQFTQAPPIPYDEIEEKYAYTFEDLDRDGIKEIIKEGTECIAKYEPASNSRGSATCSRKREVFRFDGVKYVVLN